MLNVMYHFVGRNESLKGISIKKFKEQLDILCAKRKDSEFTLTFDHGTIDHIEIVAPELEKKGIKGEFFIITMIPEEQRIPYIDKQRYLESFYRFDLSKMLCLDLEIEYNPEEAKDYLSMFKFYSIEERYLRFLRDYIIPVETYQTFMNNLFEHKFGNESEFVKNEYMSWEQVIDLHRRGHTIGSHSHYHIGDIDDYSKSIKLIENVLDEKVTCIAYPNGIKKMQDNELKALGIEIAYISTENGKMPYRAERVDCAQLIL